MRLALFAPKAVAAMRKRSLRKSAAGGVPSSLPSIFSAREVETPSGTFGYLRIRTFSHWPPEEFVAEFIRLLAELPRSGLIIDVRANGGGVIMNGELILQTLSPRRIEPEPLQFLATQLNLSICRANGPNSPWADLSEWVPSLEQALDTGAPFSAGYPITDPQACNAIGQLYFGPVALITDALCYSTTDIFAAGFQDHGLGVVLGTDGSTGAGGANVWEQRYFVTHVLPDSVYEALPNGSGMRVSIRRTLRVGDRAGAPLEDLGVVPDEHHQLSRRDLLEGNTDLVARAGELLAAAPARDLVVETGPGPDGGVLVEVSAQGMDSLDVYVADRPHGSVDLDGGSATFEFSRPSPGEVALEIRGYDQDDLVARFRTMA